MIHANMTSNPVGDPQCERGGLYVVDVLIDFVEGVCGETRWHSVFCFADARAGAAPGGGVGSQTRGRYSTG